LAGISAATVASAVPKIADAIELPKEVTMVSEEQSQKFVDAADLSGLTDYQSAFSVLGGPSFEPDSGRSQSVMVGSAINSFVKGLTEERRNAINDSSLFAQLDRSE
jgi:hypothetical protein